MSDKIIEITPELEKRHTLRRLSDVSSRLKLERYDRLVVDAKFQFEFWSKLWHGTKEASFSQWYWEGQTHAYAHILEILGLPAECPCGPCTSDRIAADTCERVGADHNSHLGARERSDGSR